MEVTSLADRSRSSAREDEQPVRIYEGGQRQFFFALRDLVEAIFMWRVWSMLAWQDIRLRYKRSVLGPWWLTLSMAVTVYSLGILYSKLFGVELEKYFPYIASGMIAWGLVSMLITEFVDVFVLSEGLLRQVKMPYLVYVFQLIFRSVIIFLHNVVVMIPLYFAFPSTLHFSLSFLWLMPGIMLLVLLTVVYGVPIAMFGARYRDISPIIKSLTQVAFFITPIMWNPDMLSARTQQIVAWNPFYMVIELLRQPLLGSAPTWFVIKYALILLCMGAGFSFWVFAKYRSRIVYWL